MSGSTRTLLVEKKLKLVLQRAADVVNGIQIDDLYFTSQESLPEDLSILIESLARGIQLEEQAQILRALDKFKESVTKDYSSFDLFFKWVITRKASSSINPNALSKDMIDAGRLILDPLLIYSKTFGEISYEDDPVEYIDLASNHFLLNSGILFFYTELVHAQMVKKLLLSLGELSEEFCAAALEFLELKINHINHFLNGPFKDSHSESTIAYQCKSNFEVLLNEYKATIRHLSRRKLDIVLDYVEKSIKDDKKVGNIFFFGSMVVPKGHPRLSYILSILHEYASAYEKYSLIKKKRYSVVFNNSQKKRLFVFIGDFFVLNYESLFFTDSDGEVKTIPEAKAIFSDIMKTIKKNSFRPASLYFFSCYLLAGQLAGEDIKEELSTKFFKYLSKSSKPTRETLLTAKNVLTILLFHFKRHYPARRIRGKSKSSTVIAAIENSQLMGSVKDNGGSREDCSEERESPLEESAGASSEADSSKTNSSESTPSKGGENTDESNGSDQRMPEGMFLLPKYDILVRRSEGGGVLPRLTDEGKDLLYEIPSISGTLKDDQSLQEFITKIIDKAYSYVSYTKTDNILLLAEVFYLTLELDYTLFEKFFADNELSEKAVFKNTALCIALGQFLAVNRGVLIKDIGVFKEPFYKVLKSQISMCFGDGNSINSILSQTEKKPQKFFMLLNYMLKIPLHFHSVEDKFVKIYIRLSMSNNIEISTVSRNVLSIFLSQNRVHIKSFFDHYFDMVSGISINSEYLIVLALRILESLISPIGDVIDCHGVHLFDLEAKIIPYICSHNPDIRFQAYQMLLALQKLTGIISDDHCTLKTLGKIVLKRCETELFQKIEVASKTKRKVNAVKFIDPDLVTRATLGRMDPERAILAISQELDLEFPLHTYFKESISLRRGIWMHDDTFSKDNIQVDEQKFKRELSEFVPSTNVNSATFFYVISKLIRKLQKHHPRNHDIFDTLIIRMEELIRAASFKKKQKQKLAANGYLTFKRRTPSETSVVDPNEMSPLRGERNSIGSLFSDSSSNEDEASDPSARQLSEPQMSSEESDFRHTKIAITHIRDLDDEGLTQNPRIESIRLHSQSHYNTIYGEDILDLAYMDERSLNTNWEKDLFSTWQDYAVLASLALSTSYLFRPTEMARSKTKDYLRGLFDELKKAVNSKNEDKPDFADSIVFVISKFGAAALPFLLEDKTYFYPEEIADMVSKEGLPTQKIPLPTRLKAATHTAEILSIVLFSLSKYEVDTVLSVIPRLSNFWRGVVDSLQVEEYLLQNVSTFLRFLYFFESFFLFFLEFLESIGRRFDDESRRVLFKYHMNFTELGDHPEGYLKQLDDAVRKKQLKKKSKSVESGDALEKYNAVKVCLRYISLRIIMKLYKGKPLAEEDLSEDGEFYATVKSIVFLRMDSTTTPRQRSRPGYRLKFTQAGQKGFDYTPYMLEIARNIVFNVITAQSASTLIPQFYERTKDVINHKPVIRSVFSHGVIRYLKEQLTLLKGVDDLALPEHDIVSLLISSIGFQDAQLRTLAIEFIREFLRCKKSASSAPFSTYNILNDEDSIQSEQANVSSFFAILYRDQSDLSFKVFGNIVILLNDLLEMQNSSEMYRVHKYIIPWIVQAQYVKENKEEKTRFIETLTYIVQLAFNGIDDSLIYNHIKALMTDRDENPSLSLANSGMILKFIVVNGAGIFDEQYLLLTSRIVDVLFQVTYEMNNRTLLDKFIEYLTNDTVLTHETNLEKLEREKKMLRARRKKGTPRPKLVDIEQREVSVIVLSKLFQNLFKIVTLYGREKFVEKYMPKIIHLAMVELDNTIALVSKSAHNVLKSILLVFGPDIRPECDPRVSPKDGIELRVGDADSDESLRHTSSASSNIDELDSAKLLDLLDRHTDPFNKEHVLWHREFGTFSTKNPSERLVRRVVSIFSGIFPGLREMWIRECFSYMNRIQSFPPNIKAVCVISRTHQIARELVLEERSSFKKFSSIAVKSLAIIFNYYIRRYKEISTDEDAAMHLRKYYKELRNHEFLIKNVLKSIRTAVKNGEETESKSIRRMLMWLFGTRHPGLYRYVVNTLYHYRFDTYPGYSVAPGVPLERLKSAIINARDPKIYSRIGVIFTKSLIPEADISPQLSTIYIIYAFPLLYNFQNTPDVVKTLMTIADAFKILKLDGMRKLCHLAVNQGVPTVSSKPHLLRSTSLDVTSVRQLIQKNPPLAEFKLDLFRKRVLDVSLKYLDKISKRASISTDLDGLVWSIFLGLIRRQFVSQRMSPMPQIVLLMKRMSRGNILNPPLSKGDIARITQLLEFKSDFLDVRDVIEFLEFLVDDLEIPGVLEDSGGDWSRTRSDQSIVENSDQSQISLIDGISGEFSDYEIGDSDNEILREQRRLEQEMKALEEEERDLELEAFKLNLEMENTSDDELVVVDKFEDRIQKLKTKSSLPRNESKRLTVDVLRETEESDTSPSDSESTQNNYGYGMVDVEMLATERNLAVESPILDIGLEIVDDSDELSDLDNPSNGSDEMFLSDLLGEKSPAGAKDSDMEFISELLGEDEVEDAQPEAAAEQDSENSEDNSSINSDDEFLDSLIIEENERRKKVHDEMYNMDAAMLKNSENYISDHWDSDSCSKSSEDSTSFSESDFSDEQETSDLARLKLLEISKSQEDLHKLVYRSKGNIDDDNNYTDDDTDESSFSS